MSDQCVQRACEMAQVAYERLPWQRIPVCNRALFYGRLFCRIRRAIEGEGVMTRLMHDVAWQTASELVVLIRHLLRDDELRDAHEAIYEIMIEAFQKYETDCARRERYIRPSDN
jgi:hypothetical protein